MRTTRNNDVELAYELVSDSPGEPILLVCGNVMQMVQWPDELLDTLAARGFQAARFDNRDCGRSTHCDDGRRYTLRDMADDAVAVLDALGWSSAHIFGPSLGGMIGQVMAVHHPDRVRSLTSISATPAWKLSVIRPHLWNALKIAAAAARPARDKDAAIEKAVRMYRLMTTPQYPVDESWLREMVARAHDIANDAPGGARQLAAARASGDRRAELARVNAPTLVVHGEQDPMQSVGAGRATAEAIPGARLRILPGVGHFIPPQFWPLILDDLSDLLHQANQPSSPVPHPALRQSQSPQTDKAQRPTQPT
jgi:pimeloyl-ACP methyl ester carboxylesterase